MMPTTIVEEEEVAVAVVAVVEEEEEDDAVMVVAVVAVVESPTPRDVQEQRSAHSTEIGKSDERTLRGAQSPSRPREQRAAWRTSRARERVSATRKRVETKSLPGRERRQPTVEN